MQSRRTIATVFVLLTAFTLFNVGMPVSMYLCPMMTGENPVCDMSVPAAPEEAAISHPTASCCEKIIVAERNTTPFLKSQDVLPIVEHSALAQTIHTDLLPLRGAADVAVNDLDFDPAENLPPAFLLHSAFLL